MLQAEINSTDIAKKHIYLYSDPAAPVGNEALTVPAVVKLILNTWLRDT